ncbi:hypothetical protein CGH86_02350 [Vibrio parahaemolyticus]|uniref:hypothetical protein n=1 Tax=Vibrio parahaemolyticus TaxID=670 RepID=UPI00111EF2E9|nr:hypothetical protein [Vibrio parahaemolyticus]EHH1240756.1 hypothetical protein [Vibrio parahaemolyticus]MDF4514538.1 hypothetical protein [Vibrio parahaemolyticus]MDF4519002.1 hypothetical protein [Vibrio parahaemolyticus]MDF4538161.1 hypothetical protein [Vibrio parahaemolyticus]MDF4546187.1 hypothetical protein [Vibrio parahaemolyticus]
MIYYLPKFWYAGSKKWGIPSDLPFIEGKLQRLNMVNQKVASEQYEDIYKHFHNCGEWRKARELANQMLNDIANDYGITLKDYEQMIAANDDDSENTQFRVDLMIEKAKKAQKLAKPRIHFKELKRA